MRLGNIVAAYNAVRGGADREFAWDAADIERGERYGDARGDAAHRPARGDRPRLGSDSSPASASLHETLKNYGSTLEEARADLVALYFAIDPKLVELGLMPSVEVGKRDTINSSATALLQQLYRVPPGDDIEEDHMRNRQLIAAWLLRAGCRTT